MVFSHVQMTGTHLGRQDLSEDARCSCFMLISPLLDFSLQTVPSSCPGSPNPSTLSLTFGDHQVLSGPSHHTLCPGHSPDSSHG